MRAGRGHALIETAPGEKSKLWMKEEVGGWERGVIRNDIKQMETFIAAATIGMKVVKGEGEGEERGRRGGGGGEGEEGGRGVRGGGLWSLGKRIGLEIHNYS